MGSVQPKQCVTYSVCYVDIFCLSICPVFVQDLAAGLDIAAGFDFAVGLKMYRPKLLLLQVFCFVFASVSIVFGIESFGKILPSIFYYLPRYF